MANHKLTDVVTEGGFKFKINFIKIPWFPAKDSINQPPDSMDWLLMDFSATNVSDQESMFSTLGAFEMWDSTLYKTETSVAGWMAIPKDKQFVDREVKPGETASGEVVFMMRKDSKGVVLVYRGNMWHASDNPPVIDMGR